jgi:hypothetical protein
MKINDALNVFTFFQKGETIHGRHQKLDKDILVWLANFYTNKAQPSINTFCMITLTHKLKCIEKRICIRYLVNYLFSSLIFFYV